MDRVENSLWVEKFRPMKVDDCILSDEIKNVAKGIIKKGVLPNLILGGTQGTGKTTLAKAICNEFGYEYLIINGSNDRNIDTLRTTITQFASSVSLMSDMKVVILDEADYLNPSSTMPALRNFIEEFSKTCRFIFTCNYPQKIISPIHSRCTVLDFTSKSKDRPQMAAAMYSRLLKILDLEKVEYDKKVIQQITMKYYPDFRRTINELQRFASMNGNKIDESLLESLDAVGVDDFVAALKAKSFKNARKWIVDALATSDHNVIFRNIYDRLYEILEPQSIPAAILLIANYQYKALNCVDQEVNMAAFSIEAMSDLSFK